MKIKIDLIDTDPNQPRKNFSGIEELAASIKEKGLLEPITLRPAGNRYIIVIGERRFKAAQLAGLTEIEANIRDITEQEAFELAIIENVQRQDLTPIEEAKAFKLLQDQGKTQAAIAQTIGKGQSYIAHKLRLLKLPEFLTYYIDQNLLTENHIRQIMKLKDIYPPGLKRDMPQKLKPDIIENEEAASFFLSQLRPEGKVILLEAQPAQVEALKLFASYVLKHNFKVDQWLVAGLWWASIAAIIPLNVADLTTSIKAWQERYYDAINMYHLYYKDNNMLRPEQEKEHWGFWEDLKHSGSLTLDQKDFKTEEAVKWWADILNYTTNKGNYCLPSNMQEVKE